MCTKLILTIVGSAGLFSLLTLVPTGGSLTLASGIKRLLLRTVLTTAFIVFALVAVRTWSFHRYFNEHDSIRDQLVQMRQNRRPENIDAVVWEVATTWTITAHGNVCFSPQEVTLSELKRLRADVEKRLAGHVDLTTTDWIWQRLGETGPHGQKYRQRFEPEYREDVYGSQ